MTALDCYAAAFCILIVLFTMNICGVVKSRSGVDLVWSWIAAAFFTAGAWLQSDPAVGFFCVVFVALTALNTWIGLRRGS